MRKADWKRDQRINVVAPSHSPCADFEPSVRQFAFRESGSRRENASAGHVENHFVMGPMVDDRRLPRVTVLGGESVYFLRQPSLAGPADRLPVSGCLVVWAVYEMADPALPDGRDVAATLSRHFRQCRCGDFGLVSRHKPAGHRFLMFPQLPTLWRRASRSTFVHPAKPKCTRTTSASYHSGDLHFGQDEGWVWVSSAVRRGGGGEEGFCMTKNIKAWLHVMLELFLAYKVVATFVYGLFVQA